MTRDPKSIERQGAQRRCSNGRGSAPSTLSTSWGRRLASLAVAMSVGVSATLFTREGSAANCAPSAPGYGGFSTCFDSNNLWLRPGSSPFVSVGPSTTVAEDKLSFGLGLTYLSRPVGVGVASADPDGSVRTLVDNVVDATFLFGVGLTDRLELTLAAPVTLFQDGAGIGGLTGDGTELTRSVVRDFRFGLAYAVVARPRVGPDEGFALVLRNEFAAPTGDPRSFASSQGVVMRPSAVASYRTGRLELALEGGARLRRDADFAGARIGSQVEAALGAAIDVVRDRKLTLGAEAFGLFTVAEQKRADGAAAPMLAPIEWMATLSSAPILGGDLSFQLHGGGPIPTQGGDDGPDGGLTTGVTSPRFRFGAALRYAPTGRDTDGDGVLDRDDACPTLREDRDGFEDADGCPEPDNDKDGIPDEKDRCRNEAETFDGFQDEDGCPDPDDDGDGILDGDDQCRNDKEDFDGFEDGDGCPEPDNDKDGIPDEKDVCPRGAEDFDGYNDTDGCPDPDNDGDRILDGDDQCPLQAEDKDGFDDTDGCPEPDNDGDGVLDGKDACPNQPETLDGKDDDDGCPEPGATSLVRFEKNRLVMQGPARFGARASKVPAELDKRLRLAARLLRGMGDLETIIIEAYPDRVGDASAAGSQLSDARAQAVKRILVDAGLPADKITAASGDPNEKRAPTAPELDVTVRRAKPRKKP